MRHAILPQGKLVLQLILHWRERTRLKQAAASLFLIIQGMVFWYCTTCVYFYLFWQEIEQASQMVLIVFL